MAANEKAAGNVAMKLHVFAQQRMPSNSADKSHVFVQWKMPTIGADVLPGSKGTKSETDVKLPGVSGDEQTPQNS
jgi:hypothetical protein